MLSKSQVKYIQSLGQKKFRDEEAVFIAEGPKIVSEFIAEIPEKIIAIYALAGWQATYNPLPDSLNFVNITEQELNRISQLSSPNEVLAVVKKKEPAIFNTSNTITLVLDTIQDPGNMGTIIRIADWFGIKQLVASHESADWYNPKVVQATMGSIARVNVLYTELVPWLKKQASPKYAAALEGKDLRIMNKLSEAIVIIGNESKGISREIMLLADEYITIPKAGKAESLNAAVAAGIILSKIAV